MIVHPLLVISIPSSIFDYDGFFLHSAGSCYVHLSMVFLSLCQLEAASVMCLHVSHSANRLDLRVIGTPFVPVFVGSKFKQVLISTVAWVLVSNPRSTIYLNAANSVLEAMAPQTWDVLIRNFHLTTVKVHALIQTDIMVLWIHSNGPDRHEVITTVAVGPSGPEWIITPLQHEHLTGHVLLLETYPRPTLHSDGAHALQPLVTDITTLSTQLHHVPLEILILKQIYSVGALSCGKATSHTSLNCSV